MTSDLKHVYCYRAGSGDCFKIGRTKNPPEKRMQGFATGSPVKLDLYRDVQTEYPSELENYIHKLLDLKRAENGEFFYITAEEVDEAINESIRVVEELQPLIGEAETLRQQEPSEQIAEPSEEMVEIHRRLRELSRQKYLIEKQMALLESKIQIAIGARCGMKGVASWKWVERWTMDIERFKNERDELYEQYKRNSSSRVFRLERVDLT
jgi:predicted phage-related endonuclease